jgi:hypothetical protein
MQLLDGKGTCRCNGFKKLQIPTMASSKRGVGFMLHTSSTRLLEAPEAFPICEWGVLGSSHSRLFFETYSFLVFDSAMNIEWPAMQRAFRSDIKKECVRASIAREACWG